MIRFRYHPTFEDYAALNSFAFWRPLRSLVFIAGALLALFLIQPFMLPGTDHEKSAWQIYQSSMALLILPGIVCFLFIVTYRAMRKRWNAAEELRVDLEYEVDDAGIRVASESFSSSLDWRHITQAEQQGKFFFLRTAQNQFYFFPFPWSPTLRRSTSCLSER
jgi:hypothetical protein